MAIITKHPLQTFGEFIRCARGQDSAIDGFPYLVGQLDVFKILRKVVQPAQQGKWITKRGQRGLPQTGRHAQPGLLSNLHHNPFIGALQCNCESCVAARLCTQSRGNLHGHLPGLPECLCVQVAVIEFTQQSLRDIAWLYVSVKNSPVHVFDYNPFISDDGMSSRSISYECIRNETVLV